MELSLCGFTYALVVDNLDNSGEAAGLKLENAANLHAAPRGRSDVDVRHFWSTSGCLAVMLAMMIQQGACDVGVVEFEETTRKMSRLSRITSG